MANEEIIRLEFHNLRRDLYFCTSKEEREIIREKLFDMLFCYQFLNDQIK